MLHHELLSRACALQSGVRRALLPLALVLLLPGAIHAQTIGLALGDSARLRVATGSKLSVPVLVDLDNAGSLDLASLQATVTWGGGRLTLDSIRVAPTSGFTLTSNVAPGTATFSAFSATALPASGSLALLHFTAAGTPGSTRVDLTPSAAGTEASQDIRGRLVPRPLDVCVAAAFRWGDANADGTVNVLDAQQIARFSIGLSVLNADAVTNRGDVNDDDAVNIIDAQQIARFGVGLSAAARINTLELSTLPVASVVVTPAAPSVPVGGRLQIGAEPRDANGTSVAGCQAISWTSNNPSVATVNASGLLTAVSLGSATITATSEGFSASAAVTVRPVSVAAVTVSPATSALLTEETAQLSATVVDSTGTVLTDRTVSWSSSDVAIASVSGTGQVTAVTPGTVTVTATSEGRSGTAFVTVTRPAVAAVQVSAASNEVPVSGTLQLTATSLDSTGSTLLGRAVIWTSSNTARATVSNTGVVTGVALGSVTITATSEGKSGSVALTVTQPAAALTYTIQPDATISAASPFTVRVRATTAEGAIVPDGLVRVRLSLVPGVAGTDTLLGTVEQPVVNGLATFTGLKVNRAASGYALRASVVGASTVEANSTAFDITVGLAAQVAIIEQPSVWTAGVAVGVTPVRAALQDAGGNLVTFATGTVTLSLASAPTGATLAGTVTATASGGIATFTTLSLTRADSSYQLRASASGLTAGTGPRFTVQSSVPVALALLQEPGNDVAGRELGTTRVEVRDSYGNRVLYASDLVTISLSGPTTALGGTVTRLAEAGVADYPGLAVTLAGSGYRLEVTAPGRTGATSSTFTIAPAPAASLVYTTNTPATVTAGTTLAPAVAVTAYDAFGNVATTTSGTVTISADPAAPTTVLGTLSRSLSGGIATFTDLSIRTAGSGYRLRAGLVGVPSVNSSAITVTPASPNRVAISQQPPASALGGTAWTPAVVARIEDAFGNLVDTASTLVTVSLQGGAVGAALGGAVAQAAVSGVATFPELSIDRAAAGYALRLDAPGLSGVASSAITVGVGPAARLRVVAQPGASSQGQPLSPAPSVEIVDAGGNRVVGATNRITLSLTGSTRGGTLVGTTSVDAFQGVATFTNVGATVNERDLRVTASATGLAGGTSLPFDVYGSLSTLEFGARPKAAFGGDLLPVQPVVRFLDDQGILVADTTLTMTVSLVGPESGVLGGTSTVTARGGQATFTNLTMNGIGGVPYRLRFQAPFDYAVEADVTLHRIDIVTQPVAEINGTVLPTTPVVRIVDGDGNIVGNQGKVIVVTVDSGPSGVLSGNSSATSGGIASFPSLALTGILGNKYRLRFAAPGLSAVRANAVQILEQTFLPTGKGKATPVLVDWTVPDEVFILDVLLFGGGVDLRTPIMGSVAGTLIVSPGLAIRVAPGNDGQVSDGGLNALGFGNGGSYLSCTSNPRYGGGGASVLRIGNSDIVAAGSGGYTGNFTEPLPYDPAALAESSAGGSVAGCQGGPGGGGFLGGRASIALVSGGYPGVPGSNSDGGFANLTMSYVSSGQGIRIRVR